MNYKPILEKALSSNDSPNLILYGNSKIDKYSIINEYLQKIDNSHPTQLNKHDIVWYSNHTYKIFNMNNIKKSKINPFFTIIDEILKCKNYYIKHNRIILLNNFDNISHLIQNKFRVIFEKYQMNTLFILITCRLNSIIKPVLSRFLCIRVNDLQRIEKRQISRPFLTDLSYDKKSKIYDKIYTLSDINMIENYSKNKKGILMNHKTIYQIIYDSLYNITEINSSSLKTIKDLSYKIEKYNLKYFHKELLLLIIDDYTLSTNNLVNICKCISDCEYNYHKSFNKILSNENLFLSILNETIRNK